MKPRKIFIIDGYPILREAFASSSVRNPIWKFVARRTVLTAHWLRSPPSNPRWSSSTSHGGFNGLDLIRQIKALAPEVGVLALSSVDETVYAERALRAGAGGYVMKQAPKEDVMIAIRKVARGGGTQASGCRSGCWNILPRAREGPPRESIA